MTGAGAGCTEVIGRLVRLRLVLLAALAAVLSLLLPTVPSSAATLPAAETRVGASDPATVVVVGVHECITAGQRPVRGPSQLQILVGNCVAAEAGGGAGRLPWTSWQNYPKTTVDGREYAQIGDRLYTRHAVDRLQPSGLGTPAGASGPGRSISPNFVEDVLSSSRGVPAKGPNGEPRLSFVSGSVQVITENGTVVTVITR